MSPDKIIDGMKVVIISGDQSHPLHGHHAHVVTYTPPLPADGDLPVHPRGLRALYDKLRGTDGKTPRYLRPDWFEQPFAWPRGRVDLYLGSREDGRKWVFPYVTVSPDDIEPA